MIFRGGAEVEQVEQNTPIKQALLHCSTTPPPKGGGGGGGAVERSGLRWRQVEQNWWSKGQHDHGNRRSAGMTQWIAYVPTGLEFALVEDCGVLGVKAQAPRKVEAVRTGNKRYPEKRVTPYLGNYVFITATADEWHWLRDIRYLRSIMGVPTAEERRVQSFCDLVEAEFIAKESEIDRAAAVMRDREASKEARREALKVMQAYTPGDLLEVICGPFAGAIVAFGAMVERSASKLPEIEVSMGGMEWGTMRLDPLHVKKVG